LNLLQKNARKRLLRMHHESRIGHLGGCLSCLDALLFLFNDWMDRRNDVFLLSKATPPGRCTSRSGPSTSWEKRIWPFLPRLHQACGHPIGRQCLPLNSPPAAWARPLSRRGECPGKRLAAKPGRVFCLTSDGEWQEGSTWEGLIFLMHHRLTNLTVLIDSNKLQAFGTTEAVASMEPLRQRIEAFGATTIRV
jgi:transketolase